MSPEAAWTTLVEIAGVGAAVWVVTALAFFAMVRARPARDGTDLPLTRARGVEGPRGNDLLTGQVEVEGRSEDLARKLAEALGRNGLAGRVVRVLERSSDRVVFEVLSVPTNLAAIGRSAGQGRTPVRGEVVFAAAGSGRSHAGFALASGSGHWLVVCGWLFLALGLVALVGGFLLLRALVIVSPNPGTRAQAVQMVQCVHLLWPPWLFGLLYRRGRDALHGSLSALLANLPYL